jgi:transcriptional regulator with XRE-family HTH domain
MNLTLGESIRIIRRRAKMSQAQLARKSGLSRGAISLLERNGNATLGTLIKVGEVLGFAIDIQLNPAAPATRSGRAARAKARKR